MSDINYNEVFGLDEEDTGEEVQEVADPAEGQAEDTGVNEQEAADPAGEDDETPAAQSAGADDDTQETAETEEGKQSRQDNAAFAAARRKAEQERDAAILAERHKYDQMIAEAGFVNPFTNQPVQTMDQLKEYSEAARGEKLKNLRAKSGLSQEEFDGMVQELPQVKEAKALTEQVRQERIQQRMQEHLKEISQINPGIHTMEDLAKDPRFPEIREKVRTSRMSVSDAYKLVYHDELVTKASERAAASARQAAAGKSHMRPTTTPRGKADTAVPQDVAEMYRVFNPEMSAEDIQKDYNKRRK